MGLATVSRPGRMIVLAPACAVFSPGVYELSGIFCLVLPLEYRQSAEAMVKRRATRSRSAKIVAEMEFKSWVSVDLCQDITGRDKGRWRELIQPTRLMRGLNTLYGNPLVTTVRIERIGGARRDRTADLLHAMQALSQLSYSPISCGLYVSLDRLSIDLPISRR